MAIKYIIILYLVEFAILCNGECTDYYVFFEKHSLNMLTREHILNKMALRPNVTDFMGIDESCIVTLDCYNNIVHCITKVTPTSGKISEDISYNSTTISPDDSELNKTSEATSFDVTTPVNSNNTEIIINGTIEFDEKNRNSSEALSMKEEKNNRVLIGVTSAAGVLGLSALVYLGVTKFKTYLESGTYRLPDEWN